MFWFRRRVFRGGNFDGAEGETWNSSDLTDGTAGSSNGEVVNCDKRNNGVHTIQ